MSGVRPGGLSRARGGQIAENAARAFLRGLGREIVESNFRTRYGEIDIIAMDGDTVCFVEVRARGEGALVSAAESVDAAKRRRLARAAAEWLALRGGDAPTRFDVIEAAISGRTARVLGILEGAFTEDDHSGP